VGRSRRSSAGRGSVPGGAGRANDKKIVAATKSDRVADVACAWAKMQIGQSESPEQQSSEHSSRQPRGPTISIKPIPSSATNRCAADLRSNRHRKGCGHEVISLHQTTGRVERKHRFNRRKPSQNIARRPAPVSPPRSGESTPLKSAEKGTGLMESATNRIPE
jgi:hypothetical protein